MLKPICVKCQRFYRVRKNGFAFVEGMPNGTKTRPEPGTEDPDAWGPYKLWSGDLWQCEGCGHELISGTGRAPIAEHYQPDFDTIRERYDARLQVNDC